MRANLPAGTGPKPALHDGKPILHTHPSGGQVYLADDGTGWWKVEAMPAPTEVLVPRIEDMAPGTTFTASEVCGDEHRFQIGAGGRIFPSLFWTVESHGIDPSTIRDVTPPAGT